MWEVFWVGVKEVERKGNRRKKVEGTKPNKDKWKGEFDGRGFLAFQRNDGTRTKAIKVHQIEEKVNA